MPSTSPFIVAEMSANHLRSLRRALDIVAAAAEAGADAIKLQTWTPGTMCVDRTFEVDWAGRRRKLSDLYEEAHTTWAWHEPIFRLARELGLVPFSAAFDKPSVDFLETLGVDRHKVASFELVDLPLIRYMASKGKPMILSTGMATVGEIRQALGACHPVEHVTLLKCTSAYPADASDANLATLPEFWGGWKTEHSGCFHTFPGVSDHSLGTSVAVAAAALGATYIEKHLTLARADGGPDATFSMEPAEFKQMVTECQRAAAAIGKPTYGPGPSESAALRRSLWVVKDMEAGEAFRLGVNVATARPALGSHPDHMRAFEGMKAARRVAAGTPLLPEMAAS